MRFLPLPLGGGELLVWLMLLLESVFVFLLKLITECEIHL